MTSNIYIGWDIGGAHLKIAALNQQGAINFVQQIATPVWQGLDRLIEPLLEIQQQIASRSSHHVITMTAELADIFKDRRNGVKTLAELLAQYFKHQNYQLYAGKCGLINADQVSNHINHIASANWYATASYTAQHIQRGILIDIGSTTTDLIPFSSGQVINTADSDHRRLRASELIYTGIVRTPVMAVVQRLFFDGQWQNIVAENFATMADVYRLTGDLREQDDILATTDSAGKTKHDSARRLARMLGLDFHDIGDIRAMLNLARLIADIQLQHIEDALQKILSRIDLSNADYLIGAGAGHFLVRKMASRNKLKYIDFTETLNHADQDKYSILSCAAAVAVAHIARALN